MFKIHIKDPPECRSGDLFVNLEQISLLPLHFMKLLGKEVLYFLEEHPHLGFYSLSNVFSHGKHISSKSNISVLAISSKRRNIKIIAPSPPPPLP